MKKFIFNKYFLRQFVIYLLLISWYIYANIDNDVKQLCGNKAESTVKFVYEAF